MTVLVANDAGAAIGSALLLLVILALATLWVSLVDAIRVPNDSDYRAGTKLIWVLVIVLTRFVGAAVYLAVGRPARQPTPQ